MLKTIKQRLNKTAHKLKDATQVGVTSVFILSQMFIPFLAAQPVRAGHLQEFPDTQNNGETNDEDYWCGLYLDTDDSVKFEGSSDDTKEDIEVDFSEDGKEVDVSSNDTDKTIELVVVKAGSSGGDDGHGNEVYDTSPFENLTAPDNKGISHVIVCYDEEEPETTVEVIKKLQPTNDNDNGLFDLRIDSVVKADDVGHNGTTGKVEIDPSEDVHVDEKAAEGTSLSDYTTSIECRNEGGQGIIVDSANPDGNTSRGLILEAEDIEAGDDIVCVITNTGADFVDYCDPSQRPGGMSIVEWLSNNEQTGEDCFSVEVVKECGSLNVIVTEHLTTDWTYWAEPDIDLVDGKYQGSFPPPFPFPMTFDEDENGGSVNVSWHLDGVETDYLNLWNTRDEATVNTDCEPPVDDFCDPAQRPAGMSIKQWLESEDINGAECFEIEIVQECGSLDVTVTEFPTQDGWGPYEAVYTTDGSVVLPESANTFPANFDEEENGGAVDVTWYIVGPEGDYLEGFDLPNFWDGEGETITVDTDCEPDVKVIKYHDINQNGEFDEGEPKLPDWKFFLDKCELFLPLESQGFYGDCLQFPLLNGEQTGYTAQNLNSDYCYGGHDHCEKTDENGEAEFKNLEPFTLYRLSEKLKNGWIQSNIECDYTNGDNQNGEGILVDHNSHLIFVVPDSDVICEVGNYRQAELDIAKSNDATDSLLPGQTANFTITVTNPEDSGILHDVKAYDLIPEGLSYVSGSAEIDGIPAVPEPDYTTSEPAVWELGNMDPGDVLVLTYTVEVDENTAPGTYTNVAWTDGCEEIKDVIEEESRCAEGRRLILGNVDSGEGDPFVESDVRVAAVLGETETKVLAVTGVPAILLPATGLAIMAVAIGATVPNRKWRRMFGKFAQFSRSAAMGFMALVLSVGMTAGVSAQGDFWRLTVNDMDTQTNVESVEIGWQITATDSNDTFDVSFESDGPGSNDVPLTTVDVNGSESGTFTLPLPADGEYDVTIMASQDSGSSTDVSEDNPHTQTISRDTVEGETVVVVQDDSNVNGQTFSGQTAGSTTDDSGVVSDAAATDSQQADDEEGQEQAATDEAADDENGENGEEEEDEDNSGVIVTVIVLAGLAALLYNYFVRNPNQASN